MRTGIYIDDTGTPGNISKSKYDTYERKTLKWLGELGQRILQS